MQLKCISKLRSNYANVADLIASQMEFKIREQLMFLNMIGYIRFKKLPKYIKI